MKKFKYKESFEISKLKTALAVQDDFLRKLHREMLDAKANENTFYSKHGDAMILIKIDPLVRDIEEVLFDQCGRVKLN